MLRYWWVALVSLGFLPALFLSNALLASVAEADRSCTSVEFGAPGSRYGGCSMIAGELIVTVMVSWIAPLSVLAGLLYLLKQARRGGDDREVRPGTTEGSGATIGRLALFVRVVSVLVGLANMIVIGDPRDVFASPGEQTSAYLFGTLLLAAVAGLAASEIILRLGRGALRGKFLARYGIVVLGTCLGGAMLGGSSLALGLPTSQPGAQGSWVGVPLLVYAALAYGSIAAVVGGVLEALEGMILGLPLAVILGKLRGPRGMGRAASLPGAALLGLLMLAVTVSGYAVAPPAPPEAASTSLRVNPPVSCQGGKEEIGAFAGLGDQTTPAFEISGDRWGYEVTSAGSGSLGVTVLDEDGNIVSGPDEYGPGDDFLSGGGTGGAEFASGRGTFNIEIDADDTMNYEITICDETDPSGKVTSSEPSR